MDLYRRNFLKAQNIAETIICTDKNHFLASIPAEDVRIEAASFVPSISGWNRLMGYRMKNDINDTLKSINEAMHEWVRSGSASGSSCAFVVSDVDGELSILYGSGESCETAAILNNSLPECEIADTGWNGCHYLNNGIMTGTIASLGIADMAAHARINNFYIACICVPTPDEDIQREFQKMKAS